MSKTVMEIVSGNMKRLRKERNMSQEDVAAKVYIARPVISNWERGVGEPSTSQLFNLARAFSVSLDILTSDGGEGKKVAVVDTSMLIKRPAIVKELLENFDEVIIPRVVIDELNNQKDNAKTWLKQRAWLVMIRINETKNKKLIIAESREAGGKNDEKIAKIAIERASRDFGDKVYVFANDVWFSYLIKEKRSNLSLLTYDQYKDQFAGSKDFFNTEKTQNFMALLKNKEFSKIKAMDYDPEIDINCHDPETGYTPIIQAVRHKDLDVIKDLLSKYKTSIDFDLPDKHKYTFTPLLHTAQMQNISLMKLLVEAGADIDVGSGGDNSGNTPIMVCAWHGFYDGVRYLVEQGACLNQQDDNGFTALTKACIKGHPEIAALLIKGTDTNIRSRENKKAIEYIKPNKKNSAEMYKLFREETT